MLTNPDDPFLATSRSSFIQHLRAMEPRVSALSGKTFSVDAGYLETIFPNAFANRDGDTHVVGMHTSLPVVIQEFALFCFAQADFFPHIGDSSNEVSPAAFEQTPPGLRLLLAILKGGGELATPPAQIVPIDPHRHVAAIYLSLLMMRFVWFHELGHGVLGHVDYLRSLSTDDNPSIGLNELYLTELIDSEISIDPRFLQCMEFEADSWALSKSLIIQRDGLENIEGIKAFDADTRYHLTLFGLYAMSWLMEVMASTMQRGRLNITHPAPIRRMQMLQNMAVWELDHLGLDTASLTRQTLVQFQGILKQIGRQWLQTDRFEPVSYRAVFEEMRDTLAPFRYVTAE